MSQAVSALFLQLFDQSWEQEKWTVPVFQALEGVGPLEAAWLPPGGGNTIWQTINHLNTYNERLFCLLTDKPWNRNLPDNDATFGDAGNPTDADGWRAAVEETRRIHAGLREALAGLDDAGLDKPLGKGTLRDELAEWVQHDTFHAGQIVLMRKEQQTWPQRRG
jgi:hypothetical protein